MVGVTLLSGSNLSVASTHNKVSKLATIANTIAIFQTSKLVIAGVIQLALGYAKAGFVAYFFPSSVIKGMLTGIGLLIILKQIPHALGWDKDVEGDDAFLQADGQNTFSEIARAFEFITPGALLIAGVSLAILILWDTVLTKKHKIFQLLQGPIVVVVLGIFFNLAYVNGLLPFSLNAQQIVSVPVPNSMADFIGQFTFPDFSAITTAVKNAW